MFLSVQVAKSRGHDPQLMSLSVQVAKSRGRDPQLMSLSVQVAKSRGRDPQRALKTLPPGLEVRQSDIPDAGKGVFATQPFEKFICFGPYEGQVLTDAAAGSKTGYSWMVRKCFFR